MLHSFIFTSVYYVPFFLLDPDKIKPAIVLAEIGRNVTLTCNSTHLISWLLNDGKLPNNIRIINEELHIHRVRRDNRGYYECNGIDENNEEFLAMSKLQIKGE